MSEKSKVKGYSRLSKSKSGFKVIRVKEFLRKKNDKDNTARNVVLGVGALGALGIGTALLLKKKGSIKFPGQLAEKNALLTPKQKIPLTNKVVDVQPSVVKEVDNVVTPKTQFPQVEDPWTLPTTKPNKKSVEQTMQKIEKIKALPPAKFKPETIPDFWDDAITNKTSNSISTVVQPNSKSVLLLTGKKIPASRGNLVGVDNRIARRVSTKAGSDAVRIENMEKTYKSIDPENLAMRAIVKIDHYLKRPRKTSNLGAPPKSTSLKEVLDNSSIKKAQEKVIDRLSRAERKLLQKKSKIVKKN